MCQWLEKYRKAVTVRVHDQIAKRFHTAIARFVGNVFLMFLVVNGQLSGQVVTYNTGFDH